LHLDPRYYAGQTFTIEAHNNSERNKFIQSAQLNGQEWNKPWFSHDVIRNGGTLIVEMGPEPNYTWGSRPEDVPPSIGE
jgi:putative alpha-1,2-mannosidase